MTQVRIIKPEVNSGDLKKISSAATSSYHDLWPMIKARMIKTNSKILHVREWGIYKMYISIHGVCVSPSNVWPKFKDTAGWTVTKTLQRNGWGTPGNTGVYLASRRLTGPASSCRAVGLVKWEVGGSLNSRQWKTANRLSFYLHN